MLKWSNKKVLVTGAGGFIGSHLTETLVRKGASVRAFVKYNSRNDEGHLDNIPVDTRRAIEVFFGDVQKIDSIKEAVKDIDVVFNLAALVGIPYSYVNPMDAFETNTSGILNIMTLLRDNDIQKVIHTSTSEVYGTAKYVPIDEDHPLQAQSPYSASKIAADALVKSFQCSFSLPVATIRPFNCYGPRQSARAVIPTIIMQALSKQKITLGALDPKRDFTFVEDTVNGFLSVAESDKSNGEVFNIGSGDEISVGDLCKLIIKIIGKDCEIVCSNDRLRPEKSEVNRLLSSSDKAKKILRWEPEISLKEGLEKTIAYVRDNLDLYDPNKYFV